jgi:hypothetical protein
VPERDENLIDAPENQEETMSQERLNGLAMCTIERDILDTIDLNTVLDDFASRNVRRNIFI